MYFQFTTRCQMSCAHCGFSCTAKGQDMDLKTFEAALDLAVSQQCAGFTIGGGEPTLHKDFFKFTWRMIEATMDIRLSEGYSPLYCVTNGGITDKTIKLAKMAQAGFLGARLSLDQYHDEIDYSVIEAFTKPHNEKEGDLRAIENGDRTYVVAAGRAKENQLRGTKNRDCFCDEIIIAPDGQIWQCGCRDVSFGNIHDKSSWHKNLLELLSNHHCSQLNGDEEYKDQL